MQNTCALKQDSNLQETTSLTENCPIFTRMKKNVIYNNADSSYYTCMSIELDQNESDINAYIIESNIAWSCNEDKLIDISLFVNGNNVTKIYKGGDKIAKPSKIGVRTDSKGPAIIDSGTSIVNQDTLGYIISDIGNAKKIKIDIGFKGETNDIHTLATIYQNSQLMVTPTKIMQC